MKPLLHRCLWCRDRIGAPSWINERGQIIQLPQWVNVAGHDITDGLCNECLTEQLALAETTNQRAQQETT